MASEPTVKLEYFMAYVAHGVHLMSEHGQWHRRSTDEYWRIKDMLEYKLVLRPLSDFSGKRTGKDVMDELGCDLKVVHGIWALEDGEVTIDQISLKTYRVMCENHIDFERLIDAGLAIDKNTL
jgi:hypothetical protein